MMVQFLDVEDMIEELQELKEKPLIRIQDIQYQLKTKEHEIPFHKYEIKVTTQVNNEVWYYVEHCGSQIILHDDDNKDLVENTQKILVDIIKMFEVSNFETRKGIYEEGENI